MLTATDPLPRRPRRVAVAGVAGSGKSTLARRLGALLGLPYTEMDSLHHGPGWTKRPEYARPLLTEHADLMVWVDLPFPVTLSRVVRRTLRRRLRREELWNGNQ